MKLTTMAQLEAGLAHIRQSPKNSGVLSLIVRRPREGEREVLPSGELDLALGLVGDNWKTRGSRKTPDGTAHPEMQIHVMNSRVIALLGQDQERWPLAGDQLFVDLDLSVDNLPTGSRLGIGSAVIEVTAPPHSGCNKFLARFGPDALTFVNSPTGKALRLRGLNARVIQAGWIRVGDKVEKIPHEHGK